MKSKNQIYRTSFSKTNFQGSIYNGDVTLFQAADVHWIHFDQSSREHKQLCDEISLVYNGSGRILHNGSIYNVKEGDIHICFHDDLHKMLHNKSSGMHFYCIGYLINESNPLFELNERLKERIKNGAPSVLGGCGHFAPLFCTLLNRVQNGENDRLSNHILSAALNYIIYEVLNLFMGIETAYHTKITLKDNLLYYIINYLNQQIYDIDAISKLPNVIGYSSSYISHIFSEKFGQSLRDYFVNLRMSKAHELLATNSVTRVAELMGYSSIHSFSRAYSRYRCANRSSDK